ncbi:hypothetical protein ACQPZP_43775 [Spirillospora sp. CA-142024]|uniref:hypothetical protein n=1 Tax=Spirillospora sp. CA-142024 TaxID=3240036 RepID=UPI003D91CDBD
MSMPAEPPELRRLGRRRRPGVSAIVFVVVIFVFPSVLLAAGAVYEASRTADAYEAAHEGVAGTFTVEWSDHKPKGGYKTSGMFVSSAGAVPDVLLDGDRRHRYGERFPVRASGPHPHEVYRNGSNPWVGDLVATLLAGALPVCALVMGVVIVIRRGRRRSPG